MSETRIACLLPVEHWHELVGDPAFGDAILDRLVHGAHRITRKGRSMRRTDAEKKEPNRSAPPGSIRCPTSPATGVRIQRNTQTDDGVSFLRPQPVRVVVF